MRTFKAILLVSGIVAAIGCSKGSSEPQPAASQGNEAPPIPATGSVPMTKLTDGQIAEILSTVDSGEIEQAQVAQQRATRPEVRDFASHMIEQHTASKQAGAQLATQANLQPASSPKAEELQAASKKMLDNLSAADASNFDITYVDGQIEQHAAVLKLIQDQLAPAVNEPALRDQLTNARGMVQQHLDQARQLKK